MINPIVTCVVAPRVRPVLTKSCSPAPLSTVLQRTPKQFEKHLNCFLIIPKSYCLFYLGSCSQYVFVRDDLLPHHIGLTT